MTIQCRITEGTQSARPWRVLRRALGEFEQDRIPSVAAAITFFFLLALFPALACIVSIYGAFADRATIVHELTLISGFVPDGALNVLQTDLDRLAALPAIKFNLGFLVALVLAVWSASGGVKALIDGLNVAYETRDTRSFLMLSLDTFLLTFIAVISAALAIALAVALPAVLAHLPFDTWFVLSFRILIWPLSFAACVVLSSVIYRFGPNRTNTKWRWITWGGVFASAAWIGGTMLFAWYVRHFGHYNEVYGNLGAIVGFLTWIWLSLVVLLLGAEINCEIERNSAS
jgi:membrane protein